MNDIEIRRKDLLRYFAAGAVIIVLSLVFSAIPSIMLGSFKARINNLESQTTLTPSESNLLTNLRSSRNWWEIMQITAIDPITTILLAVGLLLIAYGFIIRFL